MLYASCSESDDYWSSPYHDVDNNDVSVTAPRDAGCCVTAVSVSEQCPDISVGSSPNVESVRQSTVFASPKRQSALLRDDDDDASTSVKRAHTESAVDSVFSPLRRNLARALSLEQH